MTTETIVIGSALILIGSAIFVYGCIVFYKLGMIKGLKYRKMLNDSVYEGEFDELEDLI